MVGDGAGSPVAERVNPHPYAPKISGANPLVTVMGRNGAVASHHYLASQAGVEIMRQGGTAVDAAVAVSAMLSVVEPAMTGAAGNGNLLFWSARDEQTYALDFSGSAPAQIGPVTTGSVYFGARAQMVPGNLGGWLAFLERFGTMDREAVFAPAIYYAGDGFPVSPTLAYYVRRMVGQLQGAECTAAEIFAPGGRVPEPGEILRQADLANTYRVVVRDGADAFYRGEIAARIVRSVRERDGWLSADDLRDFKPEWQTPIGVDYRGWTVFTPPPPCSGIQILETLAILEGFDLDGLGPASADFIHTLVEAIKLTRHDRVYEGSFATADDVDRWLAPLHIADLRALIDPAHAAASDGDWYAPTNTTHFVVGDRDGNLVSSTQTLGAIFGSGMIAEGTGLILNGLLFLFDANPKAPNRLAAGKKVDLVMSPVLARHSDGRALVVGSPGGQGSLQTIIQMFANIVHFGLTPQAAVEAPRFLSYGRRAFIDKFGPDHDARALAVEDRLPSATQDELRRRGHVIEPLGEWSHAVGAGAAILRRRNGVLEAGADPRRDGLASAF